MNIGNTITDPVSMSDVMRDLKALGYRCNTLALYRFATLKGIQALLVDRITLVSRADSVRVKQLYLQAHPTPPPIRVYQTQALHRPAGPAGPAV